MTAMFRRVCFYGSLVLAVVAYLLLPTSSRAGSPESTEVVDESPEISEQQPPENSPVPNPSDVESPKESETSLEVPSLTNPVAASQKDAAQEKKKEPSTLFYGYWKQGLYIKNPRKRFELKIGGKIMADGGYIKTDDELEQAFPGLEGEAFNFRRVSISFAGSIIEKVDFKLEVDFANVEDVKDEWIRFPGVPVLKYMTFGHIKEPFSLDSLSSLNYLTFMERALTDEVFTPGRNIGVLIDNRAKEKRRMTWALGWFLNTGSYSLAGDARNQIDKANGYDISARITGLPRYRDDGRELLHLGLSYNYRNRDAAYGDSEVRLRTRPESRLTDQRLIDTGTLQANAINIINPELAYVHGPLSLQSEFFYAGVQADEFLQFWGTYAYASFFLTGEHRLYSPTSGRFSKITPSENFEISGIFSKTDPDQDFQPKYGLGAFELGARYSYVNLNDRSIQGGKEHNITLGLNWYIKTNARVMLNYIFVNVKDRAEPELDDGLAHIFQTRFQIHF